jgi:hypothetical protein
MAIGLSENFTLEEMLYSSTAEKRGIKNKIHDTDMVISNLEKLCKKVLQPVRDKFGPIIVTSGYSNVALSFALGRKLTSEHYLGRAADIVGKNVSNIEIAKWIEKNLDFNQLIYEVRKRSNGIHYSWVHVSYRSDKINKKEVLYSPPTGGYRRGLPM